MHSKLNSDHFDEKPKKNTAYNFNIAEKLRLKRFMQIYNGINKKTEINKHFVNFLRKVEQKIPIFSPDSDWKIFFNWIVIFFFSVNISYMAFLLIIHGEENFLENQIVGFLFYFIPQFFFIFEIFLNVFTAYYHKGIIVKKKLAIVRNFFKNELPFDLFVVVLPLLLENILHLSTLGHISFILRLFKLIMLFQKMESYLHLNDKVNGLYELIKLFGSIIFLNHLLACSWVYLGQLEVSYGLEMTWFQEKNLMDSTWETKYLYALYYTTTTMITVGYGDIVPISTLEIAYCICMMLISSGMFAYSLNKLGGILKEMYKKDDKFRRFLSDSIHFMNIRNVDQELQMKITRYLEYLHSEEVSGYQRGDALVGSLSLELRDELNSNIFKRVVDEIPILKEKFSSNFLSELSLYAEERFYAPDDIICRRNSDENLGIYYIVKGEVEFLLEENTRARIYKKGTGACFGEPSFFTGCKRDFTIRSTQLTNVAFFSLEKFMEILPKYPEDKEMFIMMRDLVNVYKKQEVLKKQCASCCNLKHQIQKCPIVNYVPNKELIISNYKKENYQFRKYVNRKPNKTKNPRFQISLIRDGIKKIECNYSAIIESISDIGASVSLPIYKQKCKFSAEKTYFFERNSEENSESSGSSSKIGISELEKQKNSNSSFKPLKRRNGIRDSSFTNVSMGYNDRNSTKEKNQNVSEELLNFESAKNYKIYFANNNLSEIIRLDSLRRKSIMSANSPKIQPKFKQITRKSNKITVREKNQKHKIFPEKPF